MTNSLRVRLFGVFFYYFAANGALRTRRIIKKPITKMKKKKKYNNFPDCRSECPDSLIISKHLYASEPSKYYSGIKIIITDQPIK